MLKELDSEISRTAIEKQIERIEKSQVFLESPKIREFLAYVCEQTLIGEVPAIKGPSIAVSVYGITDADEALRTSLVRVEAGRLRKLLDQYYANEGADDPIRIFIPKGAYVPNFVTRAPVNQALQPKIFAIAAIALLALLTGFYVFLLSDMFPEERDRDFPASPQLTRITVPTLAIIPFKEYSDSSAETIAKAFSDTVTADLSRLDGIRVIASTSASKIDKLSDDLAALNQEFQITHLLTGSIQRSGARYHVTAQLIDTQSGMQVWANNFEQHFDELLDAQNSLSLAVVNGLAIELSASQKSLLEGNRDYQYEATILLRQGMEIANPPTNPERLRLAGAVFDGLSNQFPDFSGGYSGKAYVLAFTAWWGHGDKPQMIANSAIELANKALALNPDDGLAHIAYAFSQLTIGDVNRALEHSWNSVRLNPNDPYILSYHGFLLSTRDEKQAALDFAQRAITLDPISIRTPFRNVLAVIHINAGNYAKALEIYAENTRLGSPIGRVGYYYRASAFAAVGDEKGALTAIDEAQKFPQFNWEVWLKQAYSDERVMERFLGPLREIGHAPS